jgi:hypothetical protein
VVDNDEKRFLGRIVIPTLADLDAFAETLKGITTTAFKAEETDPRKQGKMRKCLSCEKPFWSHGAGNRICNKCKVTDGSWD